MITALPKMKASTLRWINMANRLNYLNPNTTNNHEQQIYRLRSRLLVLIGQMKKCLAVVRTASTRKEHQASLS
jgi:hypothetical protein